MMERGVFGKLVVCEMRDIQSISEEEKRSQTQDGQGFVERSIIASSSVARLVNGLEWIARGDKVTR